MTREQVTEKIIEAIRISRQCWCDVTPSMYGQGNIEAIAILATKIFDNLDNEKIQGNEEPSNPRDTHFPSWG